MLNNFLKLFKREHGFKCFDCEHGNKKLKSRSYRGIRPIEVDKVTGSVDRCHGDNGGCIDKKTHRYRNIKEALDNMEKVPPIKVYCVDDEYYIVDGHHRVVASKELDRYFIDAEIIEYKFSGKKAS